MPLDTSIAMSVQPLQLENPMNGLMNMLKIKQAQAEISANEKALSDANKLNDLYSQAYGKQAGGKIDRASLYQSAAQQGMGAQIPALQKTFADADLAQTKADKENVDLVDAKLKQSRSMLDTVQTPEQYLAWHEANHADPILGPVLSARGITAESARKQIVQALQTPGGFEQQLQKSALGLEKFTEHFTQSANNIASNAVTMRGQNMVDARTRRGQDMMYSTPQYMETSEGLVALPKKLTFGQSPTSTPVMGADGQQVKKPQKPLPPAALKMQQDALDAIGVSSSINADLGALEKQVETGKLSFGPIANLKNKGLNAAGMSTEKSRNFSSFNSSLERLRNESLRLNTGVQTDGDAQRAWNELFQSINDKDLVKQRLGEIQRINKRGAELQQLKMDTVRSTYGLSPLDTTQQRTVQPALGGGAPATTNGGATVGNW